MVHEWSLDGRLVEADQKLDGLLDQHSIPGALIEHIGACAASAQHVEVDAMDVRRQKF